MARPRVVIIGGGFGGLNAAKALRHADVDVIVLDRKNHHVFQPLLYQVAAAALSPSDIAFHFHSEKYGMQFRPRRFWLRPQLVRLS